MRLIADLETNGLLPEVTTIHSLCLRDRDSGQLVGSYTDEGHRQFPEKYRPLEEGLSLLREATDTYWHNGIAYDLPVLLKLYGLVLPGRKWDTLVLAKTRFAHQKETDFAEIKRPGSKFPRAMVGKHSLAAWGHRLKCYKGEYDKGWESWNEEMQAYCEQDTATTLSLVNHIARIGMPKEQMETEQELREFLFWQEQGGWFFDEPKAQALFASLSQKRENAVQRLVKQFGSWEVSLGMVVPKVNSPKHGLVKGMPYEKINVIQFNPNSRQHLAFCLQRDFGWVPTEFTKKSMEPKVDEDTLAGIAHLPGVEDIMDYLVLNKRIALLAGDGTEKSKGWLDVVRDGKIYASVDQSGAVTHRGTHRVIANVPRITTPYGEELRELHYVPNEIGGVPWSQVGFDASGLELRCLAHHIAEFDGGAYVKILLEGDPHAETRNALGLDEFGKKGRDVAKTWIYAWLYGAGDVKLGLILSELLAPGANEQTLRALGVKSRAAFLKKIPALGLVVERCKHMAKTKGYVNLIDGRRALCRAEHSALNTQLQGDGAVIFKRALVHFKRAMVKEYDTPGWDRLWTPLIWYHDEEQVAAQTAIAEAVAKTAISAIESITGHYNFRCPLTGEATIGHNWRECH